MHMWRSFLCVCVCVRARERRASAGRQPDMVSSWHPPTQPMVLPAAALPPLLMYAVLIVGLDAALIRRKGAHHLSMKATLASCCLCSTLRHIVTDIDDERARQ
jgi:hypothetical protein